VAFKNLNRANRALIASVEKIGDEKAVRFHLNVHMKLLRWLIQANPVDTGRSQNAWQSSIERPQETEPPPPALVADKGAAMERVLAQAAQALAGLQLGDSSWIYNNVDYVPYLEEGHSSQAPSGFIDLALQRLAVSLERAA